MNIGYARASKAGDAQNLDLQHDALTKAGMAKEAIYEDRASGKKEGRPGLEACLKALREGDTLVAGARPARPRPAPPRQRRARAD